VLKSPQSRYSANDRHRSPARSVWTAAVDRRFYPRAKQRPVEIKQGCEPGDPILLCEKFLINTRLQPGAKGARGEKPLKRFFFRRSWFTALKRGVNEMLFAKQPHFYFEFFAFCKCDRCARTKSAAGSGIIWSAEHCSAWKS
jgi:hypothetical protein